MRKLNRDLAPIKFDFCNSFRTPKRATVLLVPAGSNRLRQVVMAAKAANDYLSSLPADLTFEIYQWIPFWDIVSLSLTSKSHLTMVTEALRAAKMHNPDSKRREGSHIDAYHSMGRRTPEVSNWGHTFKVIIDACDHEMSALTMDSRVGLAKILAKYVSREKPWKVCYGCLKFLCPLIKDSETIWRGEWDWDFVRSLRDGPLPYDG